MDGRLQAAVDQFLAENRELWATADKAFGCCVVASYDFRGFLRDKGFDPEIWDIVLDRDHDSYICPEWYPDIPSEGHCVVFVDGLVVDWTARQYDPNAPYPLVFVPRFGGDRKEYEKWTSRNTGAGGAGKSAGRR